MTRRPWILPLLGIAGAVLGLLPQLVHGMRLPLQNLWATSVTEDTSPAALLPFSQYAVLTIAALLVVGAAIPGLAGRLLPGDRSTRDRLLLLVGVLLVQTIAIVQTALVVGAGLQQRTESAIYLALLVAGSIFSALVGALVLLLITARRCAPVVVGVALAMVLVPSWIGALLTAPVGELGGPYWVLAVVRWLPPIGVGLAVAWSGVRTPGRIAAAAFAALTLWIGPAVLTAFASATGTRVYARYPAEMLAFGLQVFGAALGSLEIVLPTLLVAAVIAAAGIAARGAATRRARPAND